MKVTLEMLKVELGMVLVVSGRLGSYLDVLEGQ